MTLSLPFFAFLLNKMPPYNEHCNIASFSDFFKFRNKARNAGRSHKNAGNKPKCGISRTIDDFCGACAVKGNGAGRVKRVDNGDVFDALLFREETLTRHYFILKFDCSWGIRTNMGKTEGIFLNLQCNCHIVGSIIIKLINHRTISVHGCQI